jgi:hypothetical protein
VVEGKGIRRRGSVILILGYLRRRMCGSNASSERRVGSCMGMSPGGWEGVIVRGVRGERRERLVLR